MQPAEIVSLHRKPKTDVCVITQPLHGTDSTANKTSIDRCTVLQHKSCELEGRTRILDSAMLSSARVNTDVVESPVRIMFDAGPGEDTVNLMRQVASLKQGIFEKAELRFRLVQVEAPTENPAHFTGDDRSENKARVT